MKEFSDFMPISELLFLKSTESHRWKEADYGNNHNFFDKFIYLRLAFESHCFHGHAWSDIKCLQIALDKLVKLVTQYWKLNKRQFYRHDGINRHHIIW